MKSSYLLDRPSCFRDLIREWSHYLRTVANKLNGSNKESANHFYNVHYAIGPEHMTNIFSLDEDYLRILTEEEEGKTPEKVMRELIESLKIVIREGDGLGPEFTNQPVVELMPKLVWASGLKNYLCDLKDHLESRLAKNSAKRFKIISEF